MFLVGGFLSEFRSMDVVASNADGRTVTVYLWDHGEQCNAHI